MAEQTRIKEIQFGNVGATVWDRPRRPGAASPSTASISTASNPVDCGTSGSMTCSCCRLWPTAHRFVFELSLEDAAQGETRGRGREVGPAG